MEVDTQAQGDEPASNTLQSTNTTDGCFKMPSNAQSTGANAKGDEATPPNGSVGQYVSAPPDADNTPPTAVVASTTTPAIQRLRQSRLEFKINSPSDALASPDVNQLMRSKLKYKPQGGDSTSAYRPLLRKE